MPVIDSFRLDDFFEATMRASACVFVKHMRHRLLGKKWPSKLLTNSHLDVSPPMSRVSSGARLAARIFSRWIAS